MSGTTGKSAGSQESAVARYLGEGRILVAEPSAACRTGIVAVLHDLGIPQEKVAAVSTHEQAVEEIQKFQFAMIITDYSLGRHSGLELLHVHGRRYPDILRPLFFLVTSTSDQTSVAEAAEEDVDAYILKPFHPAKFRRYVEEAVQTRVHPSRYRQAIESGKKLIADGNAQKAALLFEAAKTLYERPALACAYAGKAYHLVGLTEQAKINFNAGLAFNPLHYRCLTGLYELHSALGRHDEAYRTARLLIRHFPVMPQRLEDFIRLSLTTANHADIDGYYDIYVNLEHRRESLVEAMANALLVCGSHALAARKKARAIELYQKAALCTANRLATLREIVTRLTEAGYFSDAEAFLQRIPKESRSTPDFLCMEFLVCAQGLPRYEVIDRGRQLLRAGVHDPVIYKILLTQSLRAGYLEFAETLQQELLTRWPEERESVLDLLVVPDKSA